MQNHTLHAVRCTLYATRGQTWIEYTIVLAAVVAALLVMQRYVKAGVMGRWRTSADVFGGGQQFEPGVSTVTITEQ